MGRHHQRHQHQHHHHQQHRHRHHDSKNMSTGSVLEVFLIFVISILPTALTDSKDLRFVSYTDFHLMNSTNLFHHNDIDDYQRAVFDDDNNRIIAGARDHLVTFRIDSFEKLQMIPWFADQQQVEMCKILGHPESECHNYIKVLLINGSNLFVCGTFAHNPLCQTRPLSNLEQVTKHDSGSGVCPQRPQSSNTYVLSNSSGSLFTALSVGSHGHQHLILKTFSPYSGQVRTRKSSHWLDDPQFVAMLDVDSYIYIFFREVAVEYIPWGKLIVSRVARICKGDRGESFNRNEFKSYIKTRLNCSRPGEYPFHYDELQSIHYDQQRKIFIGAFTTSPNALPGSAVCQFHLDDINAAFKKKFKAYDYKCQCWRGGYANEQPPCKPENSSFRDDSGPQQLHELLTVDGAAQPTQPMPIIEDSMDRFTHIVAVQSSVKFKGQETSVNSLYVSTQEGQIKRYIVVPGHTLSSCLVESIELLPPNSGQFIKFMTVNPVTGLLIVATNERMYQISKERCHKFNTKTLCESAQDPYCEWSSEKQSCIHSSLPSINSCPVVKNLKRTWYGWSDWSKCSVTCGDGIQMRMLVCLDDLGRLSTSSDLRNALRCSGDNYVIRPCRLKSCEDTSVTTWSTWMANDPQASPEETDEDKKKVKKEKRFRCLCEQDGVNRCSATLQVSERSCRARGECGSRLKRLTDKKEDQHHHQTLRKCTKELVMKKEENTKMKKQLHEMMNHKHHHHHHHHRRHTTTPATTAVATTTTIRTSPTTTARESTPVARVLVKSFNPRHEISRINLDHNLEQQQQYQQQQRFKDSSSNNNNNYYDNYYNSNRLPDSDVFQKVDPSVHKARSVEYHLRNSQQNIRYHHFSLPANIYHQRPRTTPTTAATTTAATRCPTSGPNVLPVNYGIFYGYCGCRDLGSFRVCHRCNHI